ncbi:hypothetical protein BGZ75_009877 [Mortierella antarctica]|nr:hypothetical protein BGZ75_009877 [Mortierella antarctica]
MEPVNSIAIKIGNTQELGQRADTHLAQCQIPIAKKIQFPEKGNIPFVYLLEEIVHEMLRAHQHDMVCPCNTTHTELYWFSGRQSHQENIFDAITVAIMTEKTQQGPKFQKSTPDTRSAAPMSTQANEGPTEAEAPLKDENVVNQQSDKSSAQKTLGLLSPPPKDLSDHSDDNQRSRKLKGTSSPGESNQPQDQIDQDLSAAEYPTAPSSPKGCEDLPEELAGLHLDVKGEPQPGQVSERPLESQDPNLEPSRLSRDHAVTASSSALAIDGDSVFQVETEEKLPEESECSVQPSAATVPIPEIDAIVPSLDVARNVESEQSEAEDEQSDDQGPHLSDGEAEQVAPGEDVAEITRELEELEIARIRRAPGSYFYSTTATYEGISREVDMAATGLCIANKPDGIRCRNLYYLIRDFLLVLGTDPDKDTILNGSSSVIAKKYRNANNNFEKLAKLCAECEKEGQVYMLVPSPRDVDLMRDPQQSLPVKIGQSWNVAKRFEQHRENCNVLGITPKTFPETQIKYVELLEHILHEVFVAHQHDLLCGCGTRNDTNHVEVFWFERLSGGSDPTKDFECIVDALRSDIQMCQEFVEMIGDRLSPIRRRRLPLRTSVQRR